MATAADELWLKTVRQQDKNGAPLKLRETSDPLALDQTARLQVGRTKSYHSLASGNPRPGVHQCQRCGAPRVGDLDEWAISRIVYSGGRRLVLGVCPACR